jgi:DNA-binding GntR family transcriptional regulator
LEAFDLVLRELRLALVHLGARFAVDDAAERYREHAELIDAIWTGSRLDAEKLIRSHRAKAIANLELSKAGAG